MGFGLKYEGFGMERVEVDGKFEKKSGTKGERMRMMKYALNRNRHGGMNEWKCGNGKWAVVDE